MSALPDLQASFPQCSEITTSEEPKEGFALVPSQLRRQATQVNLVVGYTLSPEGLSTDMLVERAGKSPKGCDEDVEDELLRRRSSSSK